MEGFAVGSVCIDEVTFDKHYRRLGSAAGQKNRFLQTNRRRVVRLRLVSYTCIIHDVCLNPDCT
jgi:hypothetical protein